MSGKAINMGHLENMLEDLSDEQLANCVGGLSLNLWKGSDGTEGVSVLENGNLIQTHLLGSVDAPIGVTTNLLGTQIGADTGGSLRAQMR